MKILFNHIIFVDNKKKCECVKEIELKYLFAVSTCFISHDEEQSDGMECGSHRCIKYPSLVRLL